MKFQNISIYGLKLCYAQESVTNERTDKPEAIWPPFVQKVGGIKRLEVSVSLRHFI